MKVDRREASKLARLLWDTLDPQHREEVTHELSFVTSLFDLVPLFRPFLESPRIAAARKRDVINRVLGLVLSPEVLAFVGELVERRRGGYLPSVSEQFQARADEAAGRVHGEVISAYPLPPETIDRLGMRLGERLEREVILHPRVDRAVLGGLRVRVGDFLIDGTIRHRLEELRQNLSDRRQQRGSVA